MSGLKGDLVKYGLASMVAKSLGLLSSPFLTRLLSVSQYGSLNLLTALWSPVSMLQYGGMDSAYPFFKAQKDSAFSHDEILATSTFVSHMCTLLIWAICLLIALAGPWVADYAGVSKTELVLFIASMLPSAIIYWLVYVLRFMRLTNSYIKITLLGRILPIIVALPLLGLVLQPERLSLFWGMNTALQAIALLYALWEMKRQNAWPYIRTLFVRALAKDMIRYGLLLGPVAVIYALSTVADRLMVGWFLGPDDVALLYLAIAVGSISAIFATLFGTAFDPHLIDWISKKTPEKLRAELQKIVYGLSLFFFTLTAFMTIWSEWIFKLIYTESYYDAAVLVPFIVMAGAFQVLSRIGVATILEAQKPGYQPFVFGAGFIVNIAIGIYAIPKFGIIGAVVGTLIAEFVILSAWIFIDKFLLKNIGVKWSIPFASAAACLLFIILYPQGHAMSWDGLLFSICATSLLGILFFGFLYRLAGHAHFVRYVRAPHLLLTWDKTEQKSHNE